MSTTAQVVSSDMAYVPGLQDLTQTPAGRLRVDAVVESDSQPVMTYQANLTLAAATSAALSSATANFGAIPAQVGQLQIINSGANPATIAFQGGTASATNGFVLVPGSAITVNLGISTTWPSAFSTAGTTLSLLNG